MTLAIHRRWILAALAFPPSGYLATTLVGPVDDPIAAVAAGGVVGVGVGLAQVWALRTGRPHLDRTAGIAWWLATVAGSAIGLGIAAPVVGYRTTIGALAAMGVLTGLAIGAGQSLVLRRAGTDRRRSISWAIAVPALWAIGWTVTASAGVDVERQYAVFGASGALTASVIGGLVLGALVPADEPVEAVGPVRSRPCQA